MLFTKNINEITWNDVEFFCQEQKPEGFLIEYKEDFPAKLEKTICAMANTYGGLIIIGIKEIKESTPHFQLTGINYVQGLTEKITSIAITNISPPIFPEIQVCNNESTEKVVIVIRVPTSILSPHTVDHNTKVYIRTGNLNTPEDLASLDRIAWLTHSREESLELKARLIDQADRRYNTISQRIFGEEGPEHLKPINYENGILTITACPFYPQTVFVDPSELLTIPGKIRVRDYYGTDDYFPFKDMQAIYKSGTITQDGVILVSLVRKQINYTELNSFGLFLFRQPIGRYSIGNQGNNYALKGVEIIARIDQFIEVASNLYESISYHGIVDFEIKITNILGFEIDFEDRRIGRGSPSIDNELFFSFATLCGEIVKSKNDEIKKFMKKLLNNFDLPEDDGLLDRFRKQFKLA
jgi:hypothetical protein